jgi:hypothetical protein
MKKKSVIIVGIILPLSVLEARRLVTFGVDFGILGQSFSEEKKMEVWPTFGGKVEVRLASNVFAKGGVGFGFYRREENGLRVTKNEISAKLGIKYLIGFGEAIVSTYGRGYIPKKFGLGLGVMGGGHYYGVEKVKERKVEKIPPEMGMGLHLFAGVEYNIGIYVVFGEVSVGKIIRGDIFQEERSWTQLGIVIGGGF